MTTTSNQVLSRHLRAPSSTTSAPHLVKIHGNPRSPVSRSNRERARQPVICQGQKADDIGIRADYAWRMERYVRKESIPYESAAAPVR